MASFDQKRFIVSLSFDNLFGGRLHTQIYVGSFTIRVTRRACEKIAQNVAQMGTFRRYLYITFAVEKVA
jgi:hypothetical protein